MNRINLMVDFDMWCIKSNEKNGYPHLVSVKSLKESIAIRDSIRYRGQVKADKDAKYIKMKMTEQQDALIRHWLPLLEIKDVKE